MVTQSIRVLTYDYGPSISGTKLCSSSDISTVIAETSGAKTVTTTQAATNTQVYTVAIVDSGNTLIPAGLYFLQSPVSGGYINRWVTLQGVAGELADARETRDASQPIGSTDIIERSLTDTNPITFSWFVTGATITGQVSINNASYADVQGAFEFLRTDDPNIHLYTLAFDADDRPNNEGTARYKLTDGTYTRYINLRTLPNVGGENVNVISFSGDAATTINLIKSTGESILSNLDLVPKYGETQRHTQNDFNTLNKTADVIVTRLL